ncbi:hypothetical protein BJV78DRAFT_108247 [Lactifluus subvellereus]|nr:hypothetical protein BJV78DRAFT_108247 [Lactifluus subvellereus]
MHSKQTPFRLYLWRCRQGRKRLYATFVGMLYGIQVAFQIPEAWIEWRTSRVTHLDCQRHPLLVKSQRRRHSSRLTGAQERRLFGRAVREGSMESTGSRRQRDQGRSTGTNTPKGASSKRISIRSCLIFPLNCRGTVNVTGHVGGSKRVALPRTDIRLTPSRETPRLRWLLNKVASVTMEAGRSTAISIHGRPKKHANCVTKTPSFTRGALYGLWQTSKKGSFIEVHSNRIVLNPERQRKDWCLASARAPHSCVRLGYAAAAMARKPPA